MLLISPLMTIGGGPAFRMTMEFVRWIAQDVIGNVAMRWVQSAGFNGSKVLYSPCQRHSVSQHSSQSNSSFTDGQILDVVIFFRNTSFSLENPCLGPFVHLFLHRTMCHCVPE